MSQAGIGWSPAKTALVRFLAGGASGTIGWASRRRAVRVDTTAPCPRDANQTGGEPELVLGYAEAARQEGKRRGHARTSITA
jgi:hypothetical protein